MLFKQVLPLALAGLAAAGGKGKGPKGPPGLQLAMNKQHKDYFGVAITPRNDTQEQAIINNRKDFGSVTPENAMKWEVTEPNQNEFTFDAADEVVEIADSNHQDVHCHTLVWHSQLPAWVSEGNFDNETLIEVMRNHITNVAGRYKNACTRWDVVNEALNEDGTYRESVFYNTIGEAFIPIAFQIAAEVTPNSKLYYNDYNLEYNGDKTAGARRIVDLVQSYGVRIDGVGLQAHLTSEGTASSGGGVTPSTETLTTVLKGFTSKGVDVAYTELDVRFTLPVTDEDLQQQADAYARVTQSCLNVRRCREITVWGAVDKYSWIPGVFPGEGAALMWNDDYEKKPNYYAVLRKLQQKPKRGGK
ncbi:Endo-1,4-beta-xylanase [Hortaea werneckii]|uniref:Beta-xylanase n=1 Tax=Hortaea werneckii TaxID=91943 RepID=A0A3M7G2X7_HORWE|nr:Endo-1,4-beta-xylanase [Hortaea werneckii]KAI6887002.1 Endo-1,4-beta-xylanase [Hortaea werneckii]KAI6997550.1 Endo-1,4-beta-xylanase [Hortaea werneckii]KAI7089860.1 Endo-1,4-beta-xylanase [Hortaea werneckii]KAI7148296.1 Endo-1,4-beta-xylanase [Hortaea werneckii]